MVTAGRFLDQNLALGTLLGIDLTLRNLLSPVLQQSVAFQVLTTGNALVPWRGAGKTPVIAALIARYLDCGRIFARCSLHRLQDASRLQPEYVIAAWTCFGEVVRVGVSEKGAIDCLFGSRQ